MNSAINVADINGINVADADSRPGDSMKRLAAIFIAAAIVAPLAYVALATAAHLVS